LGFDNLIIWEITFLKGMKFIGIMLVAASVSWFPITSIDAAEFSYYRNAFQHESGGEFSEKRQNESIRFDFGQIGRVLLDDAGYLVKAPMRIDKKSSMVLGGVAAAIGGLIFLDDDIQDWAQRNRTGTLDDIADGLDTLGSAGTIFIGNMGLIGTSYCLREHRAWNKLLTTALISTEAQLFSEGITALTKFAVGRARPSEGKGKDAFDPFHEFDRSFPSGAAARSFAVATVFADRYEQPVPIIAYTAATLISLSRIYENDHFTSDVLAGALLGLVLGKALSRLHKKSGPRFSVIPLVMNEGKGAGFGLKYTF